MRLIQPTSASSALSTGARIFWITPLILLAMLPSPAKPARKLMASDSSPARMDSTRAAAAPMLPAAMATMESMNAVTTWMILAILLTNTITVS